MTNDVPEPNRPWDGCEVWYSRADGVAYVDYRWIELGSSMVTLKRFVVNNTAPPWSPDRPPDNLCDEGHAVWLNSNGTAEVRRTNE